MNRKLLLVGAGGYAVNYITRLLAGEYSGVIFEGVVDPYIDASPKKEDLLCAGIPVYDTMDEFYRSHSADIAVICTPTFLHAEQSICALSHGSYVLCEKPLAPTLAEAKEMLLAEAESGRFLAIGYQWSFSDTMRALKEDILRGVFGKPISFKTAISWPRNRAYYSRGGGWGGKIRRNGRLLLDSIASNACAHYLHNMLFLLGDTMSESAEVAELEGVCMRANKIENFDTCALRMKTESGVRLYYVASHAAEKLRNPEFVYTFENATVSWAEDDEPTVTARFKDGSKRSYGDPMANVFTKLQDCIDAIERGERPNCTVQTAMPHTRIIERIYREIPIRSFKDEDVYLDAEKDAYAVRGLFDCIRCAYADELLFSELDAPLFS